MRDSQAVRQGTLTGRGLAQTTEEGTAGPKLHPTLTRGPHVQTGQQGAQASRVFLLRQAHGADSCRLSVCEVRLEGAAGSPARPPPPPRIFSRLTRTSFLSAQVLSSQAVSAFTAPFLRTTAHTGTPQLARRIHPALTPRFEQKVWWAASSRQGEAPPLRAHRGLEPALGPPTLCSGP